VARLGIAYDDVARVNPRIVYCSTSGYGQTGPAAAWAGHDLNYLALGGYLHTSGRGEGGKPPLPGATIADSAAGGMHAALSIVTALLARERTGTGAYLDVSVAEGVLSLMSLSIDDHLATGASPAPGHDVLTGRFAYYDTYRCRDGKWLSVGAIEPHFYRNLVKALGCEQWLAHQNDDAVQAEVRRDFAAAFAARDRDDWVADLAPGDCCVAPVYTIEELVRDPQLAARGAFGEAAYPSGRRVRQLAPALAGMPRGGEPVRVRDADASDTEALLAEAGVARTTIESLLESGVIA
jgi:alpha-methylacyl-CoA racemase